MARIDTDKKEQRRRPYWFTMSDKDMVNSQDQKAKIKFLMKDDCEFTMDYVDEPSSLSVSICAIRGSLIRAGLTEIERLQREERTVEKI